MKVSNGRCIRHLAWKSLQASRTRNLIAIAAIALTAVLFTSLFTIALSINEGFQQSNFRQVGGFSHGGFKVSDRRAGRGPAGRSPHRGVGRAAFPGDAYGRALQ